MNDPNAPSSPNASAPAKTAVHAAQANEWGQITGLDPNATYFVVRKPTAEYTRERSREIVHEMRGFLHEQRLLTEKQMQELNEKYGAPAKAKAKEIRETLEKRFDEIAKEVEARVSRLEGEISERAPQVFRKGAKAADDGVRAETPGEMPMGEGATGAAPSDAAGAARSTSRKTPKKSD